MFIVYVLFARHYKSHGDFYWLIQQHMNIINRFLEMLTTIRI